jgi:opacity protein-like surface antigen
MEGPNMRHISIPTGRLSIASLLIALAYNTAFSQVSLRVGGGLGVFFPRSDYGGSTLDYYSGTKYGLSNGLNLHGKARLGIVGLSLVGEVDYSSLRNSGYSEAGQGNVEVSQKVYTLKAGPEVHLKIPLLPFDPYVGANVAVNRFSGETIFQGVAKVPSATYVVESTSRVGIGLTGGAIVKLNESVSLDIGLHYNLMNLTGRSWDDLNPLQDQRLDSYLALNDDRDPAFRPNDDKHFISDQRSIQSFLFTVSLMFDL